MFNPIRSWWSRDQHTEVEWEVVSFNNRHLLVAEHPIGMLYYNYLDGVVETVHGTRVYSALQPSQVVLDRYLEFLESTDPPVLVELKGTLRVADDQSIAYDVTTQTYSNYKTFSKVYGYKTP
jgi:hypothetical protein